MLLFSTIIFCYDLRINSWNEVNLTYTSLSHSFSRNCCSTNTITRSAFILISVVIYVYIIRCHYYVYVVQANRPSFISKKREGRCINFVTKIPIGEVPVQTWYSSSLPVTFSYFYHRRNNLKGRLLRLVMRVWLMGKQEQLESWRV